MNVKHQRKPVRLNQTDPRCLNVPELSPMWENNVAASDVQRQTQPAWLHPRQFWMQRCIMDPLWNKMFCCTEVTSCSNEATLCECSGKHLHLPSMFDYEFFSRKKNYLDSHYAVVNLSPFRTPILIFHFKNLKLKGKIKTCNHLKNVIIYSYINKHNVISANLMLPILMNVTSCSSGEL